MNCPQCGKRPEAPAMVGFADEKDYSAVFCNRACLRAWLGPDRSLTRRLEAAQNRGDAPQPIVFPGSDLARIPGESYDAYLKRLLAHVDAVASTLR